MPNTLTRRGVLFGAATLLGSAALAEAPARSDRPRLRPWAPAGAADVLARSGLSGRHAAVLLDAASGQPLDAFEAGLSLPPASTLKAITALYSLDVLGAGYRFRTRLRATGPIEAGTLRGDLILQGGGDPRLDTDDLSAMAEALAAQGVRSVSGRFLVDASALPEVETIDRGQPPHVSYSPAVGGLNLNFNRVHFEWARQGAGYAVTMQARAAANSPDVARTRMRIEDRSIPVFEFARGGPGAGATEDWSVARGALGGGGSRWLPVRAPDLYAGEVFATLAGAKGISLAEPAPGRAPQGASELVRYESPPLETVLTDMLRFSTNVTAEATGLTASAEQGRLPGGLPASGAAMAQWMEGRHSAEGGFVDHSGLGDASLITAASLAQVMAQAAPGPLPSMLKPFALADAPGPVAPGLEVMAKTGTLNFVSTLAGYIGVPGERPGLAFAILSADVPRRAAIPVAERERPAGARSWERTARGLQRRLLAGWIASHG
jgi:D-alanyl-D-alanine carboxypeptidase/D-alanyl-D-alanine-endopeptidase (penicillin-binding protein 4)